MIQVGCCFEFFFCIVRRLYVVSGVVSCVVIGVVAGGGSGVVQCRVRGNVRGCVR